MEIWEQNHNISDRATNGIVSGFEDAEETIYQLLKEYLYQFEISGGSFNPDQDAAGLINGIKRKLGEVIQDVNIDDQITEFLDNFDEIESNVVNLHRQENDINVSRQILNSQKTFAVDSTIFSIKEAQMRLKFVDPIKKLLYHRVQFGSSVLDTDRALREIVTGKADEFGILKRWIGQVARDSINQYEGTLNQEIKVKYDLGYTSYVGSLVEDSRIQCGRWVGMGRIKDEDLAKEIGWALRYGKGMIPGTGPGNFCVNRGGYNCRHTAYPTK